MIPGDLSPNYAATLVAMAQTIVTTAGFVSPVVAGVMTSGEVCMSVISRKNGELKCHNILIILIQS